MPLQPGTTLGPYSVTAKIGEGGMGKSGPNFLHHCRTVSYDTMMPRAANKSSMSRKLRQ